MAWRIEIDKDVQRSMKKLDKQIARRIVAKLHEISQLEDPRSMGKGLTENKSGLWRYRVGDYRIVADIEDDVLVILVVVFILPGRLSGGGLVMDEPKVGLFDGRRRVFDV